MSREEFDKMIPVNPPIENISKNPSVHIISISRKFFVFIVVASHLKILIPVGIAITIVAAVKYARESMSIPTVNIWCAHTIKPKNPIADMA